jgi:hypothetical protein
MTVNFAGLNFSAAFQSPVDKPDEVWLIDAAPTDYPFRAGDGVRR